MIKLTISRNDNIYECFPDIARTKDGALVCVYRECMGAWAFPFLPRGTKGALFCLPLR